MMAEETQTAGRCFQVAEADNVATLLDDVAGGRLSVYGPSGRSDVDALGPIALGHKVAVGAILAGAPVVKYGVPIGVASANIAPGEWVHLHNCRSQVDERSNHLDVATGATRDTRYA